MDYIFYKSLRSDSCLYQTIKSYTDFFKTEELDISLGSWSLE